MTARPTMRGRVALRALVVAFPAVLCAARAVAQEPNQSELHLSHVVSGFEAALDGRGLAVTGSTEVGIATQHADLALQSLRDLPSIKMHAGHILHALDPPEGAQGPGLGWGIRRAAETLAIHIELAARSAGASENLRAQGALIATTARQVAQRAQIAAGVARRIQITTSAAGAGPMIEELRNLTHSVAGGRGSDEPGWQQLEEQIYALLEAEGLPLELR